MKKSVRFVVAGLMLAGFATAQAQSLPESGSSDLWLFVSNSSAGTTFAEDTGIALSSIMPKASLAAANSDTVLSTAIGANFALNASSVLTSYINSANSAGQSLQWSVLGAQFPSQTNNASIKPVGNDLTVFSGSVAGGGNVGNIWVLSTLSIVGNGFDGDVGYLASSYTAGGKVYKWTDQAGSGPNVWGAGGSSGNGGSTNLYGQNPDQSGIGLGSAANLYGTTGNGNTGNVQSYVLGTNLTLSSAGNLQVSSVPLPAAVWLFGSGLLGLIGVGRRRAAVAA